MEPVCCGRIARMACLQPRNTPSRLVRCTACQSASSEPGHARVVHHHVQAPALGQGLRGDAPPIVFLPHIERGITGLRAQRIGHGAAPFMVDVGDIDEAALLGEHAGNRFADALGRPGDDGHFGIKSLVHT